MLLTTATQGCKASAGRVSRRGILGTATASILGAQWLAAQQAAQRLRILVAGAHPGDPECGCGGTIARYVDLGHHVTVVYLNRGQGFCSGAPAASCGDVRTAEADEACRILHAQPLFANQRDGSSIVDNDHYETFRRLIESARADIIFVHWPLDKHRDHRALASLVVDAWLTDGRRSALYFYEVADDTMMFAPAGFVDISKVETRRRAACYAHRSQLPDKWYPHQEALTRFRGTQCGVAQAEGFLRHWESKAALLP